MALYYNHDDKFLSTPSARRATENCICNIWPAGISIHALREEGDRRVYFAVAVGEGISIHALREEGDTEELEDLQVAEYFYPRPPRGGRPHWRCWCTATSQFLSTPSARRATKIEPKRGSRNKISIHALREEGDVIPVHEMHGLQHFYPRPPRGGRLGYHFAQNGKVIYFYPRPPRGGRLAELQYIHFRCWHFYPRPPRGGRLRGQPHNVTSSENISIHALREEGDAAKTNHFYSAVFIISIHALREEGDTDLTKTTTGVFLFLSTPSARRATSRVATDYIEESDFYPRPPRGGRLDVRRPELCAAQNFYPRPPRGGRPKELADFWAVQEISIHALREEGDATRPSIGRWTQRFLSTPSARRATGHPLDFTACRWYFYPRPPRGGRRQVR